RRAPRLPNPVRSERPSPSSPPHSSPAVDLPRVDDMQEAGQSNAAYGSDNARERLMRSRVQTDNAGRRELLAILLDARRAQTGKAVLVDRILPGEKFFDRQ